MRTKDDPMYPSELTAAIKAMTEGAKEVLTDQQSQLDALAEGLKSSQQELVALRDGRTSVPAGRQERSELSGFLEKSDHMKALREGSTKGVQIRLPADFMSKATLVSTGITSPQHVPDIVLRPHRRFTIRALLRSVQVQGGGLTYLRQNADSTAAAPVPENTLKPESTVGLELVTCPIIVLAHWMHASKQVLDDIPQLTGMLDDELRYGLAFVEELQILKGSGTSGSMSGLYTNATAAFVPTGAAAPDTTPDQIRRAISQLQDIGFDADGVILHPEDWASMELMKGDDGQYIIGAPRGPNPPTLWNVPVVTTNAMTVGTFLVGAFQSAAFIADRQTPTLDIATMDGDDFVRNLIKLRMEERIGLAITRPAALVRGTFPLPA